MKAAVIAGSLIAVVALHYFTYHDLKYHHAFYRMLFYLPLILGAFWFGITGALGVLAVVTFLYLPYVVAQWGGFTIEDFNKLLELVLFGVIALVLGTLVEKERKEHRALLRSEGLAAVGRTVSEVAHDMKTPLMAIGGFARQASRSLPEDDSNQRKLEIIVQETERLESLVKEMLDFGRPLELEKESTSLNDLVQESIRLAGPVAGEAGVQLNPELDPSMPLLEVDPSRMKQALLNLISNAVQASPEGEEVRVTTRSRGGAAEVAVSDRGEGIPGDQQDLVFQPFFSTKKDGTGLGLGLVKKIVEAHEGEAGFHPRGGGGVTFYLRVPADRG